MTCRTSFVEHFGEDQALSLEAAANEHENGLHPDKGSDPFQWVLMLVISYECASRETFAKHHGITAPWCEVDAWIKAQANMASYDGDVDMIAALTGAYTPYVKETQ